MGDYFYKQKARNRNNKGRQIFASWLLLLKHVLYSGKAETHSAPHIRADSSVQSLLNKFIIASIPCWVIGLWNLGYQINLALSKLGLNELPGWQGGFMSVLGFGHDPANIFVCWLLGLLFFLPIFVIALLSASIWEVLFAGIRHRPFSEGILVFSWLFTMLMPADIDLFKVFLGVSFGYVIGSAIFGGYGRYLVSPILLSVVFLLFSYPDMVANPESWVPVPGADVIMALNLAATGGVNAVQAAGFSWWNLFIGIQPGPIGSVSVLGCVLAAIYLVITDSASWRIMIGALLGMFVSVLIYAELANDTNPMSTIPVIWHWVLGALAFGVVFFATDPVSSASTPIGRFIFGVLVGILATVIRISNPSYNEGVLFAVLLASLFSPVIDFCLIEMNVRKRRNVRNKKLKAKVIQDE